MIADQRRLNSLPSGQVSQDRGILGVHLALHYPFRITSTKLMASVQMSAWQYQDWYDNFIGEKRFFDFTQNVFQVEGWLTPDFSVLANYTRETNYFFNSEENKLNLITSIWSLGVRYVFRSENANPWVIPQ